ncbi:hypothetical protein DFAR_3850032 [Desulfarculales bacterium]
MELFPSLGVKSASQPSDISSFLDLHSKSRIIELKFLPGQANLKRSLTSRPKQSKNQHHQEHAKWTPERTTNWIHNIGEATAKLAEGIMSRRAHPQQGFRACIDLTTLAKNMVRREGEASCLNALAYGAFSSKSVERIIDKELWIRGLC